jgi:peptidoglycan hydrolase-like protein with peptidoglycan-binding domain
MARIARSLDVLRTQINGLAPGRSKASDGWLGDAAHAARPSDHNPNRLGVVQALDITHDPANGFNSWRFADMLRERGDVRIKYVISNGRIFAGKSGPSPWTWRPYTGSNKHDKHVHVSVQDSEAVYDDLRSWDIGGDWSKLGDKAPVVKPLLRKGSPYTADVTALQRKLGLTVDGIFGPKTEAAVMAFQRANGLTADGLVGPYTREKLGI